MTTTSPLIQYRIEVADEFIFDLRRSDVLVAEGYGTRCDTPDARRFPFDYVVEEAKEAGGPPDAGTDEAQ